MATRKSNQKSTPAAEYVAPSLENRVRALEKRAKRNDLTLEWQTSLIYRLTVSVGIYITTSLVLMALLIPAWPICAIIPVFGYGMTLLILSQARNLWNAPKPDNRKI